jgi:uncharacterized lipoprotein YajG
MTRTYFYVILPIACAALLSASCASGGTKVEETTEQAAAESQAPETGTPVLIVENRTAEPVDIYVDGKQIGSVEAEKQARFSAMPQTASVEARARGTGEVVDSANVDFTSTVDNTETFVVDGA